VQIGDIGPLGDDIEKMLGDIFAKYGGDTPAKQEALCDVLFRYDERFGILANREFIAAAVEVNNNRHQGFFDGRLSSSGLVASALSGAAGGFITTTCVRRHARPREADWISAPE
jgi:hypothetical protein